MGGECFEIVSMADIIARLLSKLWIIKEFSLN
jgi:hypothetical protein